jgi:hypothetical protein
MSAIADMVIGAIAALVAAWGVAELLARHL